MKWTLKKFQELSVQEFHDIVQLRLDIFVVEQDCAYLDLDGKDEIAYHLFGTTDQGKQLLIPDYSHPETTMMKQLLEGSWYIKILDKTALDLS